MQTQPKRVARSGRFALGLLLVVALVGTTSALALANPSPAAQPDTPTINWQVVHNTPGVYWYTLSFPTPSVGYAIGGPDWNDPNSGVGPVTVAKTTNGGQTWTSSIVPNTNRFMRGLTCTDASHCWIAGASSPRIQYTANGGASWSPGTIVNNVWTPWLWSAGWTGSGTTILAGTTGYSDEPGRRANILRATDGVNFNAVVANDPREFVVYDFSCPIPGTCYAAAKQTAFYTSDNAATLIRRVAAGGPILRHLVHRCNHMLGGRRQQRGHDRRRVLYLPHGRRRPNVANRQRHPTNGQPAAAVERADDRRATWLRSRLHECRRPDS